MATGTIEIIKHLETIAKIQGDIIDKLIEQKREIDILTEKNARLECELTMLKKQMEEKR